MAVSYTHLDVYKRQEYATAKSVVQSYYGKADGKSHTITVSDLSEDGVRESMRYGTEAHECLSLIHI